MENGPRAYYLAECRKIGWAPTRIDLTALDYFGRPYEELTAVEARITFDINSDEYPQPFEAGDHAYHIPA